MKIIVSLVALFLTLTVAAQELNCTVQVVSPAAMTNANDKEILDEIQKAVFEFMNDKQWTNDIYDIDEKIECNILINISERLSTTAFRGTIQIQSSRIVFNSSYKSTMLNHMDSDFEFVYVRNSPLLFSLDQHRDNLTSVLAFYTYMILGLDYDSFSLEGGTTYFNNARTIVANAAGASETGWKAKEGNKNRYWFVDNMLQSAFKPLRQATYKYHRLGMDKMYDNANDARAVIRESILLIQKVYAASPGSMNVQIFFTAKADEIVNIYEVAPKAEKSQIFTVLTKLDPGNISKYQKMMK